MPEHERAHVLEVKRGEVPLDGVLTAIEEVVAAVEDVLASGRTPPPPCADLQAVSAWASRAHRRHWGWA